MKLLTLIAALVFAHATLANAQPSGEESAAEKPAPTDEQIQQWITQLGDEDFQTREAADRNLYEAGEVALPALRVAAQSATEFEVRDRANRTFDRIADELQAAALAFFRERGAEVDPKILNLNGEAFTDDDMVRVARVKTATRVRLVGSLVTDEGLKHLGRMENLEILRLDKTKVTDAGIAHLQGLTKLQGLTLNECAISDVGVAHISKIRSLRSVSLGRIQITDDALKHLALLPKLRGLSVNGTNIGNGNFQHLRPLRRRLEALYEYDTQLSDEDLRSLTEFNLLKGITISRTDVTDKGIMHLEKLPKLERLGLDGTKVTDACLTPLTRFSVLAHLSLMGTEVTPTGLESLAKISTLRTVHVPDSLTEAQTFNLQKAVDENRTGPKRILIVWRRYTEN